MKIKWLQQVELTVVCRFDEFGENADERLKIRQKGEIDEIDILEYKGETANIQFCNSCVTVGVSKDYFELIED